MNHYPQAPYWRGGVMSIPAPFTGKYSDKVHLTVDRLLNWTRFSSAVSSWFVVQHNDPPHFFLIWRLVVALLYTLSNLFSQKALLSCWIALHRSLFFWQLTTDFPHFTMKVQSNINSKSCDFNSQRQDDDKCDPTSRGNSEIRHATILCDLCPCGWNVSAWWNNRIRPIWWSKTCHFHRKQNYLRLQEYI